jgi:hypothetical protein
MQAQEAEMNKATDKDLYPETFQSIHNYFHSAIWYAWKYNEIVGYLNLYILGSQFRADIWFISQKRINKGIIIKKKFKYLGKTLERALPRNKSSEQIFSFILEELLTLNKKREYRSFVFDLKTFKVAGQYINWVQLVDKLNSFRYPKLRRAYLEDEN